MKYHNYERKIARALERFPTLKSWAKWGYQRLSYVLVHQKGLPFYLHPSASLASLAASGKNQEKLETFFGYYDRSPWRYDDRFYLSHLIKSEQTLNIALFDMEADNFRVIGETEVFSPQQGAMLSWLNNKDDLCIYNSTDHGYLVAKIVEVFSGKVVQTLDMPVQAVNREGTQALTLNYRRLAQMRPEYGYQVEVKNFPADLPESRDGIWKIDIPSNRAELFINLQELQSLQPHPGMDGSRHKVNHIAYAPSGERFAFLHRWLGPQGKYSRLYTANSRDGGELFCLADERLVSHFTWLDDEHLLVWARKVPWGEKYFLCKDRTHDGRIIGDGILDPYGDGHPSFSPDRRWLVTDTYPDKARMRHLLLFHLEHQELVVVGSFFAPLRYDGELRCDLHPRWNHAGTHLSIDSVHEDYRNSYIIDVSSIVSHGGLREA